MEDELMRELRETRANIVREHGGDGHKLDTYFENLRFPGFTYGIPGRTFQNEDELDGYIEERNRAFKRRIRRPQADVRPTQMSNELHLPREYREQVIGILGRHAPGVEVWAYGSRVDGTIHDASDLDLVLRTPDLTPVSASAMSRLIDAFDESSLPIIVDIHDWAQIPEAYRQEIRRSHYVLTRPD